MPLTLIVTRHAKSSWGHPALDDHDRPLNGRGRKSARAIAAWLAGKGYLPELVVVSDARRTLETWSLMAPVMPGTTRMQSEPALYGASAETIGRVISAQEAETLMVIAHNPGIAEFAARMVTSPPVHPRFLDYPTCATTVLRFDVDRWRDATWGTGEVLDFVIPRELV